MRPLSGTYERWHCFSRSLNSSWWRTALDMTWVGFHFPCKLCILYTLEFYSFKIFLELKKKRKNIMHVITQHFNIFLPRFPPTSMHIFRLLLSIHVVFFLSVFGCYIINILMDTEYSGKWTYYNSLNVSVNVGDLE